ncbi:MAG: tetraacyldisaccharide 4'-kinase [Gammaproteobacteria bacterium RIFCSPHIGHO2_12_FULL_41_15]|nr:MAG: tetraacyldisaccharide 4'-kinase [Gammaproteobacteria bacterium RIFCSPHIGHO2_12_FULL_41_15]
MNIEKLWYNSGSLYYTLLPFSYLYRGVIAARQLAYRFRLFKKHSFETPIIVIGNLTVGGTGKTPVVIALVQWLLANGFKPGVVSRGYKGKATSWPQWVTPASDPIMVGDEPVLIATKTGVPVIVAPKRVLAVQQLLAEHSCDVVISDDGLQHYAMSRHFEVAVIDAKRGLGNHQCLPAGPLREPKSRLRTIDYMLVNGGQGDNGLQLQTSPIYNIRQPDNVLDYASHQNLAVHAVAGIGNPSRFFQSLMDLGFQVIPHPRADHAPLKPTDLEFHDNLPIIMTEKDMVKCQAWCSSRCYALPVKAKLPSKFLDAVRLCLDLPTNLTAMSDF